MPYIESKTLRIGTPRFSGLELMECINAMYQSGFICSDEKTKMTNLVLSGMKSGDYTELCGLITEQCLRGPSDNSFWNQMQEILSEEVNE
jgi:hypothetical protein